MASERGGEPGGPAAGFYGRYLRVERRLAPSTVRSHEDVARRFLSRHGEGDRLDLDGLTAAEVTAFVLAQARLRSVGSMKALLSPLRSLLRFLFVAGMTPREPDRGGPGDREPATGGAAQGPGRGDGRGAAGSCDRGTAVGRRDFAILTMLARLGLRAGEVAALRLDDIDWRAGELLVRGKATVWIGCRCPPMSAQRWSTICVTAAHPRAAGRCSCGRSDPTGR